jgi:phosphoglycolate phosphatase-like HAD superfamily hydrolase
MSAVVFDIDGTLVESSTVDSRCFGLSLEQVFEFKDIDPDWSRYRHTTDSGILNEVFESRLARRPSASEAMRFRSHFLSLLRSSISANGLNPVKGAAEILDAICASRYGVALGTGAWADSARLKLSLAGVRTHRIPLVTSDEFVSREEIIRAALQRAGILGASSFHNCAYVGDGVWDARACRNVGVPFIGIGSG